MSYKIGSKYSHSYCYLVLRLRLHATSFRPKRKKLNSVFFLGKMTEKFEFGVFGQKKIEIGADIALVCGLNFSGDMPG